MSGELDGKVAVVTGGASGLGQAMAIALGAAGAAVAVDDLDRGDSAERSADETARLINAAGGKAVALHENVVDAPSAERMIAATVETFGHLDILVNCAGNAVRGGITELSDADWDSLVAVHLRGHFLCCRAAVRHMQTRNTGRIINISSRGAFFDIPPSKAQKRRTDRPLPSTAYSAVKAGIMGFTTTLALEVWDTGITVNCLLPSASTPLFPEATPRSIGGLPAPSTMDPAHVAPLVVYLATDDAEMISGRMFYAAGDDVFVYPSAFAGGGMGRLVRGDVKWTTSRLAGVIPSLVDATSA
jgi:3-oxoacyl-[acyl-carrier protein] reductase